MHTLIHHQCGHADVNLSIDDIHQEKVNISWSTQLPFDHENTSYHFKVIGQNTQSYSILLNESFMVFTAPEGAPPCEVYKFSVTAAYVGATYTGAGCSVSSSVINRMLPSLPDQRILGSSLEYSLDKHGTGDVTLKLFTVSKLIANIV